MAHQRVEVVAAQNSPTVEEWKPCERRKNKLMILSFRHRQVHFGEAWEEQEERGGIAMDWRRH